MISQRKTWKENSQQFPTLSYFSLKALWYSILEAWKTTIWLSANCRNCTSKIGLRWLCLQIVFLVCLPRPTVPDKCSTQRWPVREANCTIQTSPQKISEVGSRNQAKMVDWELENPGSYFWKTKVYQCIIIICTFPMSMASSRDCICRHSLANRHSIWEHKVTT